MRKRESERGKERGGGKASGGGGKEGLVAGKGVGDGDIKADPTKGVHGAGGKGFTFGQTAEAGRSGEGSHSGATSNQRSGSAPTLSYRDKLLSPGCAGFLVKHSEEDDIVRGWKEYFHKMNEKETQGVSVEVDEEDCPMSRRIEGKPGKLSFTAEEYTNWCLPWMNSLIIKVLGASFPTYVIRDRVNRMWHPKDALKLIPLSNGYYIVSFSNKEDREYAFQEGPWMIEDHYLIVQRWRPNFNPWKVTFNVLFFAWVDRSTSIYDKGGFARIRVEIDLKKPLVPTTRKSPSPGAWACGSWSGGCRRWNTGKGSCYRGETVAVGEGEHRLEVTAAREQRNLQNPLGGLADQDKLVARIIEDKSIIGLESAQTVPNNLISDTVMEMNGSIVFQPEMNLGALEDNCRLLNSGPTLNHQLEQVVCDQDKTLGELNFIAILETRCNKEVSHRRANLLGFPNMELVDCEGYSGGIWCLWDHSITSISVIERHHQFLHLQVTGAAGSSWVITVIYASPSGVARRALWDNLSRLATSIQGAWLIGGDLNGTLLLGERRSSATFRSSVDRELVSWVDMHEMRDVGFAGPEFTWKRGTSEARLDRMLANDQWFLKYPNASVTHLPFFKSDHRPLLIRLDKDRSKVVNRPFRFIAAWVLHEKFDDFVQQSWMTDMAWLQNIAQFSNACSVWNKEVFRHTEGRKKLLLRRLDGISRVVARYGLLPKYEALQLHLWKELEDVLLQESLIWAQKARAEWSVYGDRNTRYFHARANRRRKSQHIEAIKDNEGSWVYDSSLIKGMATSFFANLLSKNPSQLCSTVTCRILG
ncbi:hypothetical protein K1719_013136 [Acacia pycnantha]|nr:hypothetical protein K1719_013136 [Acacia pycnantha]